MLTILLVISFISTLGAAITLYQIVEERASSRLAQTSVLGLLVFPTSFYLFAPYPMSLGLWSGLLAYQASRRNRWGLTFSLASLPV